jgi:hypothetical protein
MGVIRKDGPHFNLWAHFTASGKGRFAKQIG